MKLLLSVSAGALLFTSVAPFAAMGRAVQSAPPDTEIFLSSLAADGDSLKLGTPVNISNSAGYDNQPSFTPDGREILFTSARATAPAAGAGRAPATDIYAYDLASAKVRRITETPESEYSPTVTPDRRHISVVRVEADGTQRLWRVRLDGREPSLVLPEVKPVGYHAWIDERRLALFVLGKPATLQIADTSAGAPAIVATDIGRSIQRMPGGGISYVQVERGAGDLRSLTIMELDPSSRVARALVPAVAGAAEADLAWMPDGTLLMAHGGTLHSWRRGRTTWTAAADLATHGLNGVTRLAVSPAGDTLAIVAAAKKP